MREEIAIEFEQWVVALKGRWCAQEGFKKVKLIGFSWVKEGKLCFCLGYLE